MILSLNFKLIKEINLKSVFPDIINPVIEMEFLLNGDLILLFSDSRIVKIKNIFNYLKDMNRNFGKIVL